MVVRHIRQDRGRSSRMWRVPLQLTTLRDHADAVFRAQRDHRLGDDALAGYQPEAPVGGERGQDEHQLHPGELFPDAEARATSERIIRILRAFGDGLERPPVRVKPERLW